jgi:hypothetical protein
MTPRADCVIGFKNLAVLINEIADAFRIARLDVVAGTVDQPYGAARIAQEQERKVELLCKRGILCNGIETCS